MIFKVSTGEKSWISSVHKAANTAASTTISKVISAIDEKAKRNPPSVSRRGNEWRVV